MSPKNFRLAPIVILAIIFSGCPVAFQNTPSDQYIHKTAQVIGSYYSTNEDGVRQDVRIERSKSEKFPFVIPSFIKPEKGKPDDLLFQVYKVGDAQFLFGKRTSNDNYFCAKIESSSTQLVFHMVVEKFFLDNPGALPGTVISGSGSGRSVKLTSSAEQIVAFLTLHKDNKKLFPDKPFLLNKIGT